VTGAQTGDARPASDGFGAALRAARTGRGLTLADASARTRIRASYLAALEEERLDALPPHPFIRGFLRTYAVELGLDPEPLLQRLAAIMPEPQPGPIEESPRLDRTIVPGRPLTVAQRIRRSAGIVGLIAGIALLLYFAKQLHEFSQPVPASPQASPASPPAVAPAPQPAASAQQAPATPQAAAPPQTPGRPRPTAAQSAAAQTSPTPAVSPSPPTLASPGASASPGGPTGPSAGVTTPVAGAAITVDVEATGRSWLLVVADDTVVYEAFVNAGERRRWQAKGSMMVRVGNAGAVNLTVNGRNVGPLGGRGEVVSRTFRKDEAR